MSIATGQTAVASVPAVIRARTGVLSRSWRHRSDYLYVLPALAVGSVLELMGVGAGPLTLARQGVGLVDGIEVTSRTDPRGGEYHWLNFRRGPCDNPPDAESVLVGAGRITVTPLRFERTDEAGFAALEQVLGQADAGSASASGTVG